MRRLALVAFAVLVAGCGDGGDRTTGVEPGTTTTAPPAASTPTTTAVEPMKLRLFFVAPDGLLVASSREVARTPAVGGAALRELREPPTGTTTRVPGGLELTIADGKAEVTGAALDETALAQIVYTLTQFPTVDSVNGKTRKDVEDRVPAILVEQPSPGDSVESPFHVTGTANTFEATFDYSLRGAGGKELAHDFVTATSGSGERGTFDFTVSYDVDSEQPGTLSVFERSAEDGSVIHERQIPLRLLP
jgi:hypothetical protein